MQGPNTSQWVQTMTEKLDQLHMNNIWKLIYKDKIKLGYRPLGRKWVYKVKKDVNDNIARFKARWMVENYLQQLDIDFAQIFVVVIKPMAFQVLFAIAAFYNLDIDQIDVKTALFYSCIDQLIYIKLLKNMETEVKKNMICQLLNMLYNLEQSPCL